LFCKNKMHHQYPHILNVASMNTSATCTARRKCIGSFPPMRIKKAVTVKDALPVRITGRETNERGIQTSLHSPICHIDKRTTYRHASPLTSPAPPHPLITQTSTATVCTQTSSPHQVRERHAGTQPTLLLSPSPAPPSID
jgi:hypothetical protein